MSFPPFSLKFDQDPNYLALVKKFSLCVLLRDKALGTRGKELDEALDGALTRAGRQSPRFEGKQGQLLDVSGFPLCGKLGRVLLVGTEQKEGSTHSAISMQGALVLTRLKGIGVEEAIFLPDWGGEGKMPSVEDFADWGLAAMLAAYRFDRYFSADQEKQKERALRLKRLVVSTAGLQKTTETLESLWKKRLAVAEGTFFARDLVNEPPNELYPESFTERLLSLKKLGVRVEVLDEKRLTAKGFRALLAVGQGSMRKPRVVVLHHSPPSKAKSPPLVLVGKGVTFDSGGLSLKPARSMEDMKMDMGGAAAVVGAIKSLALRKAKVHCVGIVGLVENMPSANAQKPGDIVTTLSGKTVEVLNTDAEGRLVLADLLCYAQQKFRPRAIVNLATLTGAMIVALGTEYAGFFANDDTLAKALELASADTHERLWRLPLDPAYDKQIDSPLADMKNIGSGSAGSITAAQFLQRFIDTAKGKDKPSKTRWAHIDIAGVTWSEKAGLGKPHGGSGFGVRLLDRLAEALDEKKHG